METKLEFINSNDMEETVEIKNDGKMYCIESYHKTKPEFQDFIRRLYNQYVLENK